MSLKFHFYSRKKNIYRSFIFPKAINNASRHNKSIHSKACKAFNVLIKFYERNQRNIIDEEACLTVLKCKIFSFPSLFTSDVKFQNKQTFAS